MSLPSLLLRLALCLCLALNGVAAALASTSPHDCCDGARMHMPAGHPDHGKPAPRAMAACTCAGLHACDLTMVPTVLAARPSRVFIAAVPADAHPAPALPHQLRPPIDPG